MPRPAPRDPTTALVDLNVDLGELPGESEELYALATVVNVACGGHAGDEASQRLARDRALANGARIAAHPGYADRAGFGRHQRHAPPARARALVRAQCVDLARICALRGARLAAVKPHGALYHDATHDDAYAAAVLDAVGDALGGGVAVVGAPGGALERLAARAGRAFVPEGFADRGYDERGGLLARGAPGALRTDPGDCARQALALAATGRYGTLCVHGDGPTAVEVARAVRAALEGAGLLRVRDGAASDDGVGA